MDFIEFLIEAKISGYATGGEGKELEFSDGSKGFEFVKGDYRYLDRYFGFNPFSGTEFVYDNSENLIWSMNYYGSVTEGYPEPGKIYKMLKQAMQQITREFPFRGPQSFIESSLLYKNEQYGSTDRFSGRESIIENGKEVYSLSYHGGTLEQYT